MMDDKAHEPRRPNKRARKQSACQRCRTRKQGCDFNFPQCANCARAKTECIRQDPTNTSMPVQALQERVAYLEARLAKMTRESASATPRSATNSNRNSISSPTSADGRKEAGDITQVVGFLSLGSGEPTYIGSSSGISLAANLSEMVQATVWNKVLSLAKEGGSSGSISIADIRKNGAGPPSDELGERLLDAYFTFTHAKYPILVRSDIKRIHANRMREHSSPLTAEQKFDIFKLYMVYAIGSTSLKLTEQYDSTPPEKFTMTAFQYVSAARQTNSINNVVAMTLLVIYHLRSPSNTGIWYMIGLAMRTCLDLGLHREAHYTRQDPFAEEVKRRLFWSVYCLERVIAITLGRPLSIADQDIDVHLPLNIDDNIQDPEQINTLLDEPLSNPEGATLSLHTHLIRFRQLESRIQRKIYCVDRKASELVSRIGPLMQLLDEWKEQMPAMSSSHYTYVVLYYYRAMRLILQPFLAILPPQDPKIAQCLEASGQICQTFKRLLSRESYCHSFVAVHSVYVAGMTICYCLWLSRSLCTFAASNDLRACSSVLHIMAERAPSVRKYRDVFEALVDATMEHMARKDTDPDSSNDSLVKLRPDTLSQFSKAGDMVMQMLSHMTTVQEEQSMAADVVGGGAGSTIKNDTNAMFEDSPEAGFQYSKDDIESFNAGGQMSFVDFDHGYFI